jgi:hypothetical protein
LLESRKISRRRQNDRLDKGQRRREPVERAHEQWSSVELDESLGNSHPQSLTAAGGRNDERNFHAAVLACRPENEKKAGSISASGLTFESSRDKERVAPCPVDG